jgi:hypothetical protein
VDLAAELEDQSFEKWLLASIELNITKTWILLPSKSFPSHDMGMVSSITATTGTPNPKYMPLSMVPEVNRDLPCRSTAQEGSR